MDNKTKRKLISRQQPIKILLSKEFWKKGLLFYAKIGIIIIKIVFQNRW